VNVAKVGHRINALRREMIIITMELLIFPQEELKN